MIEDFAQCHFASDLFPLAAFIQPLFRFLFPLAAVLILIPENEFSRVARRLKTFAYCIVAMCDNLPPKKVSGIIEYQIIKSAFSASANYRAATKAILKRSFVAKLSIAFEEADETLNRLEDINELKLIKTDKLSLLLNEANELSSILGAAGKAAQGRL